MVIYFKGTTAAELQLGNCRQVANNQRECQDGRREIGLWPKKNQYGDHLQYSDERNEGISYIPQER